ncbi:Lsr2 family protein [Streptomyces sp. NPDC088789]|uniref:histone-like nucleoid-structuring protein Lsr2 n=1 Tax=Streptomyces sp. NPDC088789 TaxID=3365899 RepID=UPI00382CF1BD
MQRTIITLVDDLDPSGETVADETVQFALDGIEYEIDLSSDNAHVLRARLKTFIQGGRVVKTPSKRASQPSTTPAGDGATYSRHQGGVDPVAVRAWAKEQGLNLPQRGRMPKKVKEAYTAHRFGNSAKLDELKNDPHFVSAVAATVALDTAPREPRPRRRLNLPEEPPAVQESEAADLPTEDSDEASAREHYMDLKKAGLLSDRASAEGYWERRTAGGLERTDKVEKMTLVERIQILTPRNVTLLAKLVGLIRPDGPGKISYLKSSVERMENLEVIVQDPESEFGWSITDFGRHAHEVHAMGE